MGAFATLNRNKHSLTLDLKKPEGNSVFKRLVERADIVLESFRPGVMERLGLSYDVLSAIRPELIYCSISGYGQDGPLAKKAGHDINYLALTGLLDLQGAAGGPVQLPGIQVADIAGGSWQALSMILASLFRRQVTGEGAYCDVSMSEGLLPFLTMEMGNLSAGGEPPQRGMRAC